MIHAFFFFFFFSPGKFWTLAKVNILPDMTVDGQSTFQIGSDTLLEDQNKIRLTPPRRGGQIIYHEVHDKRTPRFFTQFLVVCYKLFVVSN